MYVIAGLGNPTKKYEKTRHNAGFDTIDVIAKRHGIKLTEKKHMALYGTGTIEGQKVILVQPQTFMNNSGESLQSILSFYKLTPDEDLIVIYDDISLEPGRIRIRKKGSAGGHNGIKSIIAHTHTEGFSRIKVGVGEKPEGWDLADHVLRQPSRADRKLMEEAFEDAADAIELMLKGETDQAMNVYNGKK